MKSRKFEMIAGTIMCAIVATWCFADPTTQPSLLEPGQAEARDRTAKVALATTWSHPETELRGIWISTNEMLLPADEMAKKLDQLKTANFNTVLIDAYFRGYVAWPDSAILPQYPDFNGEDVLGRIIQQAHQRGLSAHLWMEYGFYAYFTKDASADKSMGPILDAHAELLSVDFAGHRFIHRVFGDFYSICPANVKSHELLAKIFAESVSRYPCEGLNLDRIRFADVDYCVCDYCKAHLKDQTGIELRPFAPNSDEAKKWLEWKRNRTLDAVRAIVAEVHKVRPDMPVTSYVLGPDEMDGKAQAWDLWMKNGLLDAVAVSMYGADIRPASERAIALLAGDSSKLISAISCEQETAVYLTNIEVSRSFKPLGQFTWHFGKIDDDLPGLRAGPYSASAKVPAAKRRESR